MFTCRKCGGRKNSKQARCQNPCTGLSCCKPLPMVLVNGCEQTSCKDEHSKDEKAEACKDETPNMQNHKTADKCKDIEYDPQKGGNYIAFKDCISNSWEDDDVSASSWETQFARHVQNERCRLSKEEVRILQTPFDDVMFSSLNGTFVDAFRVMFSSNVLLRSTFSVCTISVHPLLWLTSCH